MKKLRKVMNVVILLLFINFSFKFAIFSVLIENKLEKVDYIYTCFTYYSLKSQNVNANLYYYFYITMNSLHTVNM